MAIDKDFAQYCCELLSSAGPCVAKRMFGGFGISVDGVSIAIIADLGAGEKLWLKGDEATRSQYAAAGCAMFIYNAKGTPRSMNYLCAPGPRWRWNARCARRLVSASRPLSLRLKHLPTLR
jgi:DNA transformation protein and related proteins